MLRTFIAATALCLVPPMADAEDVLRTITGQVTYDARIALPPGAETRIIARGLFDTTLGRSLADTGSAQVPIGFSMDLPAQMAASVTAMIRIDGSPRWVARDIAVSAGTGDLDLGTITLQPYTPLDFVTTYDCGPTVVLAGIEDDHLTLRIGDRDIAMRAEVSASGARFVAADGSDTEFWSKGDSATLTLRGTELPICIRQDDGARPYVARGNEPGWSVSLLDGVAEITADYGAITLTIAARGPEVAGGAYVFDMPDALARLTITDRRCRDDMTGMPHPHHAALDLDGREMAGCGGAPVDLLTGVTWRIDSYGAMQTLPEPLTELEFAADGRISGTAGCNRIMGSFALTGEGLTFGQMAATMMACPEAQMAQEAAILSALEQVTRFDLDDSGALLLIGGPGDAPMIRLLRP